MIKSFNIVNIHECSNVRFLVNSNRLEASKRTTYELHSDIINQSLNIQALSRALCHACMRACCVHICVRTVTHASWYSYGRGSGTSPIVRAECKRVYALRQVCVRVNYVLGRCVYRHSVNLHRPRGLYVYGPVVGTYTSIHRRSDVARSRGHCGTSSTSAEDKAPGRSADSIGLDVFMGISVADSDANKRSPETVAAEILRSSIQ